jgi:hypothetical protein
MMSDKESKFGANTIRPATLVSNVLKKKEYGFRRVTSTPAS